MTSKLRVVHDPHELMKCLFQQLFTNNSSLLTKKSLSLQPKIRFNNQLR